jgi:putative FmdB family regulatory protein
MKPRRLHSATTSSRLGSDAVRVISLTRRTVTPGPAETRCDTSRVPIYEYRCNNGHTFEVSQRMADDPITACEECGAPVERVFHPIAVHFKGSGFYTTDYARKGAAKAGDDGGDKKGSGSESKEKSDSKSDSKTAASSSSSDD